MRDGAPAGVMGIGRPMGRAGAGSRRRVAADRLTVFPQMDAVTQQLELDPLVAIHPLSFGRLLGVARFPDRAVKVAPFTAGRVQLHHLTGHDPSRCRRLAARSAYRVRGSERSLCAAWRYLARFSSFKCAANVLKRGLEGQGQGQEAKSTSLRGTYAKCLRDVQSFGGPCLPQGFVERSQG